MDVNLGSSVMGLNFSTPVLAAAGTFGYGEEFVEFFSSNDLGGFTTKTITPKPREGNPSPRIVETPSGMLNSIGLANVGVDHFIKEKLPWLRENGKDTKVIVSIAGESVSEFCTLAERLSAEEGIDAIELNLSCPNVEQGGLEFSTVPEVTKKVVAGVRKLVTLPLIAKLTPNVTDISIFAKVVEDEGANAVSIINTHKGMVIDIEKRKPVLGNMFGGLSGPAIRPIGVYSVWKVYQTVKIPIIGMGGIVTADDAIEYMLAGASLVEIGTANFADPSAARKISDGLRRYCSRNGIANIGELIGGLK